MTEGIISPVLKSLEDGSKNMQRIMILNDIEGKPHTFNYFPDRWKDLRNGIERRGQSFFTALDDPHLTDNPENRLKVAVAYMRHQQDLPNSFGWLTNQNKPILTDPDEMSSTVHEPLILYSHLDTLLNKDHNQTDIGGLFKTDSVLRHCVRSAAIAHYIYTQIDWNEARKIGLSKKDLAPSFYGALFHDWGRIFSQGLQAHEDLGNQFFQRIHLRSDIIESIHQPVPRERDTVFEAEEANGFDTVQQAIVRIADLFGKINQQGDLRQSTSESFLNSLERQMIAAKNKDEQYENKPDWEEDLILYCHRESLTLNAAVKKLETIRVDVYKCLNDINQNPYIVEGYLGALVK